MNNYENNYKRKMLTLGAIGFIAFTFVANSVKANPHTTVQDHYKNIIHKKPYSVEVCYDRQVSGDKTGDMLTGAIIGGIIGNNVTKNMPDGGTAGAIIGGILGHQNSNTSGGTQTVCKMERRYKEESQTVYSHSTITFSYEGRTHTLNFKK